MLTLAIAPMPRRPRVDGTATTPGEVLRHVRRGVQLPHEADKIGDVVGLVRRDRSPTAGSALPLRRDHQGRGLALGQAVRDRRPRVGDQAVAVLDQQVPEKGQPRFGARRFAIQPRGSVLDAWASFFRSSPRKFRPASGPPSFR